MQFIGGPRFPKQMPPHKLLVLPRGYRAPLICSQPFGEVDPRFRSLQTLCTVKSSPDYRIVFSNGNFYTNICLPSSTMCMEVLNKILNDEKAKKKMEEKKDEAKKNEKMEEGQGQEETKKEQEAKEEYKWKQMEIGNDGQKNNDRLKDIGEEKIDSGFDFPGKLQIKCSSTSLSGNSRSEDFGNSMKSDIFEY